MSWTQLLKRKWRRSSSAGENNRSLASILSNRREQRTNHTTEEEAYYGQLYEQAVRLQHGLDGMEKNLSEAARLYELVVQKVAHAGAMVALAALLQTGEGGIARDVHRSLELYERAIRECDDEHAMIHLASMLVKGVNGVQQDKRRAVKLYERAADLGNVRAMHSLAHLLEEGKDGVARDMARAIELCERAVRENDDVNSMFNLACLLTNDVEGEQRNVRRAAELYEHAAERGHVGAMNNLAYLVESGEDGVEKDLRRAMKLYERAIREGDDVTAMFNLACLLERGGGEMQPDIRKAVSLYERAIEYGDVDAMNNLAYLLENAEDVKEPDLARAIALYERAIHEGEIANALYNLGCLLTKDISGLQRNAKRAVDLFQRAVDQGHVGAMNNLAYLLEKGDDDVERDLARAVGLYERAIRGNRDAIAMFNLASLLENGAEEVPRDTKRAIELYEHLTVRGDVDAMKNLAYLLERGQDGLKTDLKRAAELYECVIHETEDGVAMFRLAALLEKGGSGEPHGMRRAFRLYERAATKGNVDAMNRLAFLLENGEYGQRDGHRAVELYERAIHACADANSMYNLACLLAKGMEGVSRNRKKALELYESAAKQGHVNAINRLAHSVLNGADGMKKDGQRAVELYERAIREGKECESMYNLACLLTKGTEGVQRNVTRAEGLYEQAAKQGHFGAMTELGKLYEEGKDGVEKDLKRAMGLYERAISEGPSVDAMYRLARILHTGEGGMRSPKRAADLYERVISKQEHEGAMYNLAKLIEKGDGVPKNSWRAVDLRVRAIERSGDENEMITLGVAFWFGLVVERDSRRAVEVLLRAAGDKKNAVALRLLANLLCQGNDGVPKNIRFAIKLLEGALESSDTQDRETNKLSLARILLSEESGSFRDPLRAKKILETSVANGYIPACHELGVLLSRGDTGVQPDPERAAELLRVAKIDGSGRNDGSGRVEHDAGGGRRPLQSIINSGDEFPRIVERELKSARYTSHQCFVLILGGPGRGKSSIVRSLQGLPFCEVHVPTEFAAVERIGILPGRRGPATKSLREMEFRTESLYAVMTRAKSLPTVPTSKPKAPLASRSPFPETSEWLENTESTQISGRGRARYHCEAEQRHGDRTFLCGKRNDTSAVKTGNGGRSVEPRVAESSFCASKSLLTKLFAPAPDLNVVHNRVIERVRMALTEKISYQEDTRSKLMRCWDFGGQTQYMMAHSLFIRSANILIFVIDLKRLMDRDTREEELRELCRWMQLAHSLTSDLHSVEPIIVGTRLDACGDANEAKTVLFSGLLRVLGKGPFDDWIAVHGESAGAFERRVQFTGIENSKAIQDAVASGLEELENMLKGTADRIVMARKKVPARWISMLEELERLKRILLTKKCVSMFVEGFPGFDKDRDAREEDVLEALRFYAGLGRVILFEVADGEYFVFMHPAEIVKFVRQVTGPEELIRERLGKKNGLLLEKGMVTREGLSILWGEHPWEVQEVMLELLCRFDLLMRVQDSAGGEEASDILIGVPALLPSGWKGFEWEMEAGQTEVVIETIFDDALPAGVSGLFIANLHRTLGEERTLPTNLRSNAVILSLRGACRVACVFSSEERKVTWVIRGESPIKVAYQCLRTLELFLEGPLRPVRCGKKKNVIRTDCPKTRSRNGCGGTGCVQFEIPKGWIECGAFQTLPNLEGECVDGKPWQIRSLLPLPKQIQCCRRPFTAPSASVPYDVFVSHAGPEKQSVAYPLREVLTTLGLRCFLDEESLCASNRTNAAQIYAAMRGSRSAMFVLSPEFASRKWPLRELQEFIKRNDSEDENEAPILFPLFYGLSVEQCSDNNLPRCEDFRETFERNGFFSDANQRHFSLPQAMDLLKRATSFVGVRNDQGESDREFAQRAAQKLAQILIPKGDRVGAS